MTDLNQNDIILYTKHLKELLPAQGNLDKPSQDLMFLHSRLLDLIFNKILVAAAPENNNSSINMDKIKSALQSQRQCRQAIESIGRIQIRRNRANKLKEPKNA